MQCFYLNSECNYNVEKKKIILALFEILNFDNYFRSNCETSTFYFISFFAVYFCVQLF